MCGLLYHNEGRFHCTRIRPEQRREMQINISLRCRSSMLLPYRISRAGYHDAQHKADHKSNQDDDYDRLCIEEHACPPSYAC